MRIKVPVAGLVMLAAIACQKSETIAPDGSTITLTANPAQVVLVAGVQVAPVAIVATVRNTIGVPLPGQDVRFTTTSGTLDPPGSIPISTDSFGNATCTLTGATVGPQITATSGKATANLTLTSGTGQVSSIVLTPSDPQDLASCTATFDFTAKAVGPTGTGVTGVLLFFEFATTANTNMTGSFAPSNGTTDVNGEVKTTLTINATTCADRCQTGKDCTSQIRARDQGSLIFSNLVTINDTVP